MKSKNEASIWWVVAACVFGLVVAGPVGLLLSICAALTLTGLGW